jgi:hypothetical protein
LERTAWTGLGGGGSGRLYCDIETGLAVEASEYVGELGIGGSWDGVGDDGRVEGGMVRVA